MGWVVTGVQWALMWVVAATIIGVIIVTIQVAYESWKLIESDVNDHIVAGLNSFIARANAVPTLSVWTYFAMVVAILVVFVIVNVTILGMLRT